MKLELISLIVAGLSIAGTLYVWITHGRKINKFQLEKLKKEQEEEKKAHIRGKVIYHGKGRAELKVFNSGKATARNVKIEFLEDYTNQIFFMNRQFEYELINPDSGITINMALSEGGPEIMKIKFIWDDNFKLSRENINHLDMN